jgi:hypothetical protein
MRAGLAFIAGVIGGAVMVAIVAIVRALNITGLDLSMLWGSLFTHTESGGTWALGFIVHLIVSGLIALIFAAVFEAIRASNWWIGLIGGAIYAVVAGLVIAGYHVAVTTAAGTVVESPGAFASNYGSIAFGTFIIAYLVYGIIVGSMYTPVRVRALAAATPREIHEEEPVGVGHEEHVHTNEPRRR